MTSELVQKLKDNGFVFEHYVPVLGEDINGNPVELEEYVVDRFPTLSELIEACGENLSIMKKGLFMGKHGWVVGQLTFNEVTNSEEMNPFMWHLHAFGNTPEEAVANLWLALNKKNVV